MTIHIATFYLFAPLPDVEEIQTDLQKVCKNESIKGTILLASEGLNATIAGLQKNLTKVLDTLQQDARFQDMQIKYSTAETMPFQRMKVRIKKEIVTLGVPEINPNKKRGAYVQANEWNELIADPDVKLIDTRNRYEYEIGTFNGSVNPETTAFKNFPEYVSQKLDPEKDQKIAMFCTGGIRCEKASSYLLEKGFKEVYHLEGGILQYLESVPQEKSSWQGECYVFDDRVTVDHDLQPGNYTNCIVCGDPVSLDEQNSGLYEMGKSCPQCHESIPEEKRRKLEDRSKQYIQTKRNKES